LDTQQRVNGACRFIVLVPHRDPLRLLEEYRARLFAAGFPGAYSFPMAAPLASVSRFFSVDELKGLARNIRGLTSGKFTTEGTGFYAEGEQGLPFFGPRLNIYIEESLFPPTARAKILGVFSPPVLCAALLAPKERPPSEEGPVISFRAASLANLAIRPLENGAAGYSFEWKMGPLVWLPKYKNV
jgi:hypothetical protein